MIRQPYARGLRFDATDADRAIEPFGDEHPLAATLGIAAESLLVRYVGPDPKRPGVTDPTVERGVEPDDVVVLLFDTARPRREGKAVRDATVLRCGWWRVPLSRTEGGSTKFRGPIPFTQRENGVVWKRGYSYESKTVQKAAALLFEGETFISEEMRFKGVNHGYMVVPLVGGAATPQRSSTISSAVASIGLGGVPLGATQMWRVYEVLVDLLPPVGRARAASVNPSTLPPHEVAWQLMVAHLNTQPPPNTECRPSFNAQARVLLECLMSLIKQRHRFTALSVPNPTVPLREALRW